MAIKLIGMNGHRIVPVPGGHRMGGKVYPSLGEAVNTARHEDGEEPLSKEEIDAIKEHYAEMQIERGRNSKANRHV